MKQTKFLVTSLCSIVLFGLTLSHVSADSDVAGKADVQFSANNGIVPPVDPGDGGLIDPNEPPTEGPLSINYASNIVFGKHKKTREEQVFYAAEDTITVSDTGEKKQVPNFVQVTDLRGTGGGWSLSVRQNGPLKKENGVAIVGAKLTVSARSIQSMYETPGVPSHLSSNQVLQEDGQSHEIVKAEVGTGLSTWNTFLGTADNAESSISLSVPKSGIKETGIYTTSLTWLLQDVL